MLSDDTESSIFEHFNYFRYSLEDKEDKLIIEEHLVASSGCATGNEELYYTYTIDKNTGNVEEKSHPTDMQY